MYGIEVYLTEKAAEKKFKKRTTLDISFEEAVTKTAKLSENHYIDLIKDKVTHAYIITPQLVKEYDYLLWVPNSGILKVPNNIRPKKYVKKQYKQLKKGGLDALEEKVGIYKRVTPE
ncbi:MAG: hypothetical protein JSW73_00065 [Candidatus Woesearchaeota archaeon]|nr:MAG: hypothetical protein JSW73_00065 [Candidatus Woesearchaeota archaeon]